MLKKVKDVRAFKKEVDRVDSEGKAKRFLRTHYDMPSDMLPLADTVTLPANTATGEGIALFTWYARCTIAGPSGEEPVLLDVELTKGLHAAPQGIQHLMETALKIAAGHGIKNKLYLPVAADDSKASLIAAIEQVQVYEKRAEAVEAKLAEREAAHDRQVRELIQSHERAMANLEARYRQPDPSASDGSDRAAQWKKTAKGIRQRYQHWKVAAITAYNVLEGRSEAVPITPITEPAPTPSLAPETRVAPKFSDLSPAEQKARRQEWGRKRWEGVPREKRQEHMKMMKGKQEGK